MTIATIHPSCPALTADCLLQESEEATVDHWRSEGWMQPLLHTLVKQWIQTRRPVDLGNLKSKANPGVDVFFMLN